VAPSKPPKRIDQPTPARALAELPSVDRCIAAIQAHCQTPELSRDYLKRVVRAVLAELRSTMTAGDGVAAAAGKPLLDEVVARARERIDADRPRMQPVVNATGVILHTNLGRALLAESALAAMVTAARAPVNLEYSLATGDRGDRDDLIEQELCELTGAEGATVVNNNAAAVLLVLNSLAEGREVIVSRGELIEIGGSFRLPDVMARAGALLREVGTTNRTHRDDYARAIGPQSALLMKVHPSNYRIVGFTATVELRELVELARLHDLVVVEDLGAGALIDLSRFGLPREPVVRESIDAGAALVTFSGDKLLGGPQAGVVVGQARLIARLKRNPLWRALRCDKLRLAALEATLRLYRQSAEPERALPTLRLLTRPLAAIAEIAENARALLVQQLGPEFTVTIVESRAQIGSGAQPAEELVSRALKITHPELSATQIAARFRRARIIGRVHDDAFLLDLRAVESAESLVPPTLATA